MKTTILLLLTVQLTFAQNINIPDSIFKSALLADSTINTNFDSQIQQSEAIAFTGELWAFQLDIEDLTGIEEFVNITKLQCNQNNLTTLDVSQNTELIQLHCASNLLKSLDVSNLTKLQELSCVSNMIESLDVSNNTVLWRLGAYGNNLTMLDMRNGNNINMQYYFSANFNPLTCISVDDEDWADSVWTSHTDVLGIFENDCGDNNQASGIEDDFMPLNNDIIELFNLFGQRSKGELSGIYILKQGNKTRKVYITK